MDIKEKEIEIVVSNTETAVVQPQKYIPEKKDSLLIEKILKRLIDILGGIVGTIVLIPLTIGIAIANLICKDTGPIFYSQYRMEKNGKLFKMYKYRSMVVGADEKLKKYLEDNEEARKEYKKYKKYKYITTFKPGLTGLWQISGRSDVDFATRIDLDMQYYYNHSLKGDIKILFKTAMKLVKREGAL